MGALKKQLDASELALGVSTARALVYFFICLVKGDDRWLLAK